MKIEAGGHLFSVMQEASSAANRSDREGVVFYGPERFWTPVGDWREDAAGRWVTHRVEEYVVLKETEGVYRQHLTVAVPEGIPEMRDAGEWLEFLDASGVAVLRLHALVARDAQGHSRAGDMRLVNGDRIPQAEDPLPRYALAGGTLRMEMSLPLEGLRGPIVVDPGWSSTASPAVTRSEHTATLLLTGKVLAAGGSGATAELYDPAAGVWMATGAMGMARNSHTATLLPTGKVLVTGGSAAGTSSAEVYDPATGKWSQVDPMPFVLVGHTATLLVSGKVLVVGAAGGQIFDPTTGKWKQTGFQNASHNGHTATLLPSGKVLVAGGAAGIASAEIYDPEKDTWTATGSLLVGRYHHTATLLPTGKVLITGGYPFTYASELYDPETGKWSATAASTLLKYVHTATLLPTGKVLVTGGLYNSAIRDAVEIYDPVMGTWSIGAAMAAGRYNHTATLLPSGLVLITGWHATSELYDPGAGGWSATGALQSARTGFTLTVLPSGNVLAAGGNTGAGPSSSAEVYDAKTRLWKATMGMSVPRDGHTATLLPAGKVLVVGGSSGNTFLDDAELYESVTSSWTPTGLLTKARSWHTATLLPSGQVLVAGGRNSEGALSSAELYEPLTGAWRSAGSLALARSHHTAVLLSSGKVLVAGGLGAAGTLASAELYDPVSNTWSTLLAMGTSRAQHRAVRLASGKVLVVGGFLGSTALRSAELYDPQTQLWSQTASLEHARALHTATLLPSGRVVVSGGSNGAGEVYSAAEVYDPVLAKWGRVGPLEMTRAGHQSVLLPTARVLTAGGFNSGLLSSSELYEDTGASDAWRPVLHLPQVLRPGATTLLSGVGFQGVSAGSNGSSRDSPGAIPLSFLVSTEGGSPVQLVSEAFSPVSLKVQVPSVAVGSYLLFVSSNGVAGGRMVRVTQDNRTPVAQAVSVTTTRRKPAAVVLQATDLDGDILEYVVVTPPTKGTLSGSVDRLIYTPGDTAVGNDTFTYKVHDGEAESNVATVSLVISNASPSGEPQAVYLPKGQAGSVTLRATDPDGDVLTYTVVTPPQNGTLSGTAPGLLYTPRPGFVGTDSFTFKASDGLTASPIVPVSLWVLNASPVAQALSFQTSAGTPVAVTLRATDADGDALTFGVVTPPVHGSLSGSPPALLYTPEPGYTGPDSFTYQASDGMSTSREAEVVLEMSEQVPNRAPAIPRLSAGEAQAGADGRMVLSWQASTDAEGDAVLYRIELLQEGAVVSQLSSASPSLILPSTLPEGVYQWRVEAVDAHGHGSGYSELQSLVITHDVLGDGPPVAGGCSTSGAGGGVFLALWALLALARSSSRRVR
ncbi:kelch repeat-containing protein [Stigmatella sp. ncwal1]|uniref:Kelch repeat-containing protein n=1 Tax=Stigmatella ashevillensis TaxID=2995309 RepID=A0ABT5D8Z9_9BACT|nr:kelch repeat-containing protein [Stigmatella ashevillena]MDC0710155.1 kelch repeat-containing protein [Stigmatella ashevillena]